MNIYLFKNNPTYNNEFKYIDGYKNAELSLDEINNIEEFLEDDNLF